MSSMSWIGQGFLRIGRKLSKLGQSMNELRCPGKITVKRLLIWCPSEGLDGRGLLKQEGRHFPDCSKAKGLKCIAHILRTMRS